MLVNDDLISGLVFLKRHLKESAGFLNDCLQGVNFKIFTKSSARKTSSESSFETFLNKCDFFFLTSFELMQVFLPCRLRDEILVQEN